MKNKAYIPVVITSVVFILSFFENMVHYNMGRNFEKGEGEEKPIWAIGNLALIPPKKDLFQVMIWSLAFSLVVVVLVQIAERRGGMDNAINAGLGVSTQPMVEQQINTNDPTMTNEAAIVEEVVVEDSGEGDSAPAPAKSSGKAKAKK